MKFSERLRRPLGNIFRKLAHFVCNLPVQQDDPNVPQIDVSDDKMASFRRWLYAVVKILGAGFVIWILTILRFELVATTIIAAILVFTAGLLLLICISRGARWARISTYILAAWELFLLVAIPPAGGIFGACRILEGICFLLASVMLLLPKVLRGLKTLSRSTRFAWMLCVLFWVMVVINEIILALNTPAVVDVPAVNSRERALLYIVPFVGVGVFSTIIIFFLNWIMGGVVRPVEVISSKKRDVACPKCGKLKSVPDTDENGLEVCPSCGCKFYPFGSSGFAIIATVLGALSLLVIPAPFALWVGALALRDIKKNRGKNGITHAWFGVIMGLIFTGAIFPIALYALIRAIIKAIRTIIKAICRR